MAKRVNFTAARVNNFSCAPDVAQAFLWDAQAPGLALRATRAGSLAYVFQSRLRDGATVRMTIGEPMGTGGGVWSIPNARAEARRLQGLIDQGKDPRVEAAAEAEQGRVQRSAERATRLRDAITVGKAWAVYLAARRSKWAARTLLDHQRLSSLGGELRKRGGGLTVAGPLAPLMGLKLADLDSKRLTKWLDEESATRPTNAAHSFRLIRGFIRWCGDHADYSAIIPADAYKSRAVRDALPSSKTKEGDSLQREQLELWFAAVRSLSNPVIAAYLQALLITGARREEMASLRWSDVDFRWNSLSIRDKVDGQRMIPLTEYVSALLTRLPRRNEWVFSSPTAKSGRLAEPRIAHNKALAIAGLPHVSLHGLRRSFGTLCEWVEVPTGIVAQIQGHKPSALAEKHYRRRPIDLLRMWHQKIEAWILAQAGIEALKPDAGTLRAVPANAA